MVNQLMKLVRLPSEIVVCTNQAANQLSHKQWVVVFVFTLGGAIIRFVGLGDVGFHGDEETTGLPARAILESGFPYFPSGMLYARAMVHEYLIAGSIALFGFSEWSLRLPSVLIGIAAMPFAALLGQRFLAPRWTLALVLVFAVHPAMIEHSQTARMYMFLATFEMLFLWLIFRWERVPNNWNLVLAFFSFLVALHFQRLAVFSLLFFLWPGIVSGRWQLLLKGALATFVGLICYRFYSKWINEFYFEVITKQPNYTSIVPGQADTTGAVAAYDLNLALLASGVFVVATIVSIMICTRYLKCLRNSAPVMIIYIAVVASISVVQFHIAAWLFLFWIIFFFRNGGSTTGGVALMAILAATAIATIAMNFAELRELSLLQMAGFVTGSVSVWPLVRLVDYSFYATGLYCGAVGFALLDVSKGQRLPDHFLFFVMVVLLPILAIGCFRWNIPPRYLFGLAPAALLATMAGVQFLVNRLVESSSLTPNVKRLAHAMLLAIVTVSFVNIPYLSAVAIEDYRITTDVEYPDHKGAAEYVMGIKQPNDIVIAEDVLQAVFYLDSVDYWLRSYKDAERFLERRSGKLVDIYTSTEIIGSGDELQALIDLKDRGRILVIGSGETYDNPQHYLAHGLIEVLSRDRMTPVYVGRDGKTFVWIFPPTD